MLVYPTSDKSPMKALFGLVTRPSPTNLGEGRLRDKFQGRL